MFNVYPGRFIRQVLSFVASTDKTFVDNYPFIKELLLDKEKNYTEKPGFHVYMYLIRKPHISISGKTTFIRRNYLNTVNELNLFPFGFLVTYDNKKDYNMTEITNFINCGYK